MTGRALFIAVVLPLVVAANDGPFLSVPAGGIHFKKTDAVSMVKEELLISEARIAVSYVFRNVTEMDFTTEVAFPLPIYDLGEFEGVKPNYAAFTMRVNGAPREFRTIERAVLCEKPAQDWAAPSRGQWKPVKDVTDIVSKHLPIGEPEAVWEKLDTLSPATLGELINAGVLVRDNEVLIPQWKVQTAYVWEQTFPANADVRIEHEYEPQAGYFNEWHLEPYVDDVYAGKLELDKVPAFGTSDFNAKCAAFLKQYDIDSGVFAWAERQRAAKKRFSFTVVDYILTTATYWKGPIGEFTLTIEKPENEIVAVSADISGLKKLDDRRFQARYTDYVPEKDLSVLFIHAYEQF